MCDDKDDSFVDDEVEFEADSTEESVPQDKTKNEKRMDARRKLEMMRERQALKDQLGDDYYDLLDNEL